MKRTERQHLKQNELATTVARAREGLERHQSRVGMIAAAVLVVALAAGGYYWWRTSVNNQASAMLAAGMTILEAPVVPAAEPGATQDPNVPPLTPPPGSYPTERARLEAALPKLNAAAEAHPGTEAGIAARYHAAATLALLGRTQEAEQRYREVIERDGSGLYGEMARLGLAETQARAGQYDAAIQTWKDITGQAQGDLPLDGALMQLGRTYVAAGRTADAAETFNRLVREFPESVYAPSAKQELDSLKPPGQP
jgi:TolA-binding protein